MAQIVWHFWPPAGVTNGSLWHWQRRFLELPPGYAIPTRNGVIWVQRKDRLVYHHILRQVVAGPGNSLVFDTMRHLYFFLIHCQRSNSAFLDARSDIKSIEVLDITSGPYVKQAIQQLRYCRGLDQLTLWVCGRCREMNTGQGKWAAWKGFRVPAGLRTLARVNNTHLAIAYRPPFWVHVFCDKCLDAGATLGNGSGGPTPSQVVAYNNNANRPLDLWNSMMR